jgi:hypothetical protein
VIFDEYTTRLRALQFGRPEDPRADELLTHDDSRRRADQAIAEVDRLSTLIDREVPITRDLLSLADVARDAGVRVSIELYRRPPEASPRG